MNRLPSRRASALIAPEPAAAESWVEHLRSLIVPSWRPGEFEFGRLLLLPDQSNPHTNLSSCIRSGCGVLLSRGRICPNCRGEWAASRVQGITVEEWASHPRFRREVMQGCLVPKCARGHAKLGLCSAHSATYCRYRSASGPDVPTVTDWLADREPRALPPAAGCSAHLCGRDRRNFEPLCEVHNRRYENWCTQHRREKGGNSILLWLDREHEPLMNPETAATYASSSATPFGLLNEPLRWEYLYAVQQRDLTGRAHLAAFEIRATYLALRRSGQTTAVGKTDLGRSGTGRNLAGMLTEWQRLIDDAHRTWSGVDNRDPQVIYLQDLTMRKTNRRVGPNAILDLRPIQHAWIAQTVTAWARSSLQAPVQLLQAAAAWKLADEVLTARKTPKPALGTADMDAVIRVIRKRWTSERTQYRHIAAIDRVIKFARRDDALEATWKDVPSRFAVDPGRHIAAGTKERSASNADEPFRFVPQPIIDWIMDHLHLINRKDSYLTAEARAMIFVHERCGRRTGETVGLKDDCISYDNQGAPYLEWRKGKPPYGPGKRLPIHQETHDVIRQWQEIKRERHVQSQWLFPSGRYSRADKTYGGQYLPVRVRELIQLVTGSAPYTAPVEGPEGNLVHFDLSTIDPYSFRHAFAQRLADATDQEGRSSTPPDVLQDYMGHQNFNTTMAYYQVTAKRRKKALSAIPARRLNLHGQVTEADRERDGFGKIAVALGHCTEPQNVAANGHFCALEHSCESCPFFLVDPLERDGMDAKRHHLRVKFERAQVIQSPQHILDHYQARIRDCTSIIDGIDAYIDELKDTERDAIRHALDSMTDIRRRATAPRSIDLRNLLRKDGIDAH